MTISPWLFLSTPLQEEYFQQLELSSTLYIGNLSFYTTEDQVRAVGSMWQPEPPHESFDGRQREVQHRTGPVAAQQQHRSTTTPLFQLNPADLQVISDPTCLLSPLTYLPACRYTSCLARLVWCGV